jgi:hypothetical protein
MAVQSFTLQVAGWAARAKRNVAAVTVITFQDMATEIIAAWPVKTGFSRASWYTSINAPPAGAAGRAQTGYQVAVAAARYKLGDVLYLGNTSAYARRLEYGFVGPDSLGRVYNQQGRFIVRGVMNRAQSIADRAAARVARGDAGGARPGGGGALPDVGFVS